VHLGPYLNEVQSKQALVSKSELRQAQRVEDTTGGEESIRQCKAFRDIIQDFSMQGGLRWKLRTLCYFSSHGKRGLERAGIDVGKNADFTT
jgi:hypothetical protein